MGGVVGRKIYYELNQHKADQRAYPVHTGVRDKLKMGDFPVRDSEIYVFVEKLNSEISGLTTREGDDAVKAAEAIVAAMQKSGAKIKRPSWFDQYFCFCSHRSKGSFNVSIMNAAVLAIEADLRRLLSPGRSQHDGRPGTDHFEGENPLHGRNQ